MFKDYNDMYGHLQGDAALQTVSSVISQSLNRSIDFVARWGGEEFVVLLPNTDLPGAVKTAETIRLNVENAKIPDEGTKTSNVTISIGLNTIIPTGKTPIRDFINDADMALFTAKRTGRNRVCKHEAEPREKMP
jgi:diguanylate cyclase (GGDEF)-like protein